MARQTELDPVGLVGRFLKPEAYAVIHVGRNTEDEFSLDLEPGARTRRLALSASDALPLLPAGSRWTDALGWYSYVGIPFGAVARRWLAVGVEVVRAHPSRGAYPTLEVCLFPFGEPPVAGLIAMSKAIDPDQSEGTASEPLEFWRNPGFIQGTARTPVEHRRVEAMVLRYAARWYEQERALLFRSLVLSEDELPWRTPTGRHHPKYLMATVPAVSEGFSWWSSRRVGWNSRIALA